MPSVAQRRRVAEGAAAGDRRIFVEHCSDSPPTFSPGFEKRDHRSTEAYLLAQRA